MSRFILRPTPELTAVKKKSLKDSHHNLNPTLGHNLVVSLRTLLAITVEGSFSIFNLVSPLSYSAAMPPRGSWSPQYSGHALQHGHQR